MTIPRVICRPAAQLTDQGAGDGAAGAVGQIPFTGFDLVQALEAGVELLCLGGTLAMFARRSSTRRPRHHGGPRPLPTLGA